MRRELAGVHHTQEALQTEEEVIAEDMSEFLAFLVHDRAACEDRKPTPEGRFRVEPPNVPHDAQQSELQRFARTVSRLRRLEAIVQSSCFRRRLSWRGFIQRAESRRN